MTITYNIIDGHTGYIKVRAVVGLKAASRKCERLNQEYGAVRYFYKPA